MSLRGERSPALRSSGSRRHLHLAQVQVSNLPAVVKDVFAGKLPSQQHGLVLFALVGLCAILLASCAGPSTAPASTALPNSTATPVPHAPEIRFALIGTVTDVNVWALFDAKGYSYNNYALRNEYWPRLYRLSIPDRQFEPMAASAMPSSVQQEGNFYTATVPLRSDLKWTDGNPFTADDVEFTVNTALSFQLGFDWHDFYNPDYLDHAQAVDPHTVKFFFKKQPNVGLWQYGVLQGPIAQKAYWSSKVAASIALLPSGSVLSEIENLKSSAADLQQKVDALNLSVATTVTSDEAKQIRTALTQQQGRLDQANNNLAKAQSDFDSVMNAARDLLYALDDKNEPTLGNWLPAGQQNGVWINTVNPLYPFGEPHFDRATYRLFTNENNAVNALRNGNVDSVLNENGISIKNEQDLQKDVSFKIAFNANYGVRFLVINPTRPALTDSAFHQALDCVLDRASIVRALIAVPLESFIQEGAKPWYDSQLLVGCAGQAGSQRLEQAAAILKSAGYTWQKEPTDSEAGLGLMLPGGKIFPTVTLLAPSKIEDSQRATAAEYVERYANLLGIALTVKYVNSDEINYAVFSSGQYDMALLGWRVSKYPGYLCDWFGDGNSFHYDGSRLKSACKALNSTSDLESARKQVFQIQSILSKDLPFIPLYSTVTYDAYRNISYPFSNVLGGLSGIYGAPALAIPAPQ